MVIQLRKKKDEDRKLIQLSPEINSTITCENTLESTTTTKKVSRLDHKWCPLTNKPFRSFFVINESRLEIQIILFSSLLFPIPRFFVKKLFFSSQLNKTEWKAFFFVFCLVLLFLLARVWMTWYLEQSNNWNNKATLVDGDFEPKPARCVCNRQI